MEKATADDEELRLRRARGRRAQQAFRQRQITAIDELRKQNHAMQAAIASIARVSARIGKPELDDAVRSAQKAAGVEEPNNSKRHHDEIEDNNLTCPHPTRLIRTDGTRRSSDEQWPTDSWTEQLLSSSGHQHAFPQPRSSDEMLVQQRAYAANGNRPGYQQGRMSPRLTYGIFLERPLFRLVNPPIDITPYLEQSSTVASVLFWTGLTWGLRVLQAALQGDSQAVTSADKIFGQIIPMKPYRTILNGIHARLQYRSLGYIDSNHPGYDPEGGARIRSWMADTCAANGTRLENYFRPDEAEEFIRSRLGDGYRLVALAVRGLGTPEESARVRQLLDKMIRSSICMGDGPRWRKDRLEKTLKCWMDCSTASLKEGDRA